MSEAGSVDRKPATGLRALLAPHVSELEAAALEADDLATADVFEALAAFGRGEAPPEATAKRILDRARGG